MSVLSPLQFGSDFHCEYFRGENANMIQAYLDELYGVFSSRAGKPCQIENEPEQLLLFFEYLAEGEGYGFGVFYTPDAWGSEGGGEDQKCLIFLVDGDEAAVKATVESYVSDIVAERGLEPMPFAVDPQLE